MENKINRRSFLKNSALIGGALGTVGVGGNAFLTSCEETPKGPVYVPLKAAGTYYIPELPDKATDGKELKAGVIGCGGRGSGAGWNFLAAANGVTITAVGDAFKDKLDGFVNSLQRRNITIPADKQFVGLDAYQKVIDSGVDVVIIATPPCFRPIHFKYAVEKGKHVFLEKPLFVDANGYRSLLATAKQAVAKNLAVVTGNQRRHQRCYVESYKKVMEGYIGEITGGNVYWNGTVPWANTRQPGWGDAEAMMRDWVNWTWLSGDHIVEQHVHNIDVFTWFSGLKPTSVLGFGSRQRRTTGDQYDNFSLDVIMENGIHVHSMCRQISGCTGGGVTEFIQGTKGSWSANGCVIRDLAGNEVWKFDYEKEKEEFKQLDPYTLEHVNWVNHIRAGKSIDMATEFAIGNMIAVMGRDSSYTGRQSQWDRATAAEQDLIPADLSFSGKFDTTPRIPIPGRA